MCESVGLTRKRNVTAGILLAMAEEEHQCPHYSMDILLTSNSYKTGADDLDFLCYLDCNK